MLYVLNVLHVLCCVVLCPHEALRTLATWFARGSAWHCSATASTCTPGRARSAQTWGRAEHTRDIQQDGEHAALLIRRRCDRRPSGTMSPWANVAIGLRKHWTDLCGHPGRPESYGVVVHTCPDHPRPALAERRLQPSQDRAHGDQKTRVGERTPLRDPRRCTRVCGPRVLAARCRCPCTTFEPVR